MRAGSARLTTGLSAPDVSALMMLATLLCTGAFLPAACVVAHQCSGHARKQRVAILSNIKHCVQQIKSHSTSFALVLEVCTN